MLFHALPRLFGFFSASEAVAEIPDFVIKNRVIPLQATDSTMS
jgi:hypothetical protein